LWFAGFSLPFDRFLKKKPVFEKKVVTKAIFFVTILLQLRRKQESSF